MLLSLTQFLLHSICQVAYNIFLGLPHRAVMMYSNKILSVKMCINVKCHPMQAGGVVTIYETYV